jgi:hypothetical protein
MHFPPKLKLRTRIFRLNLHFALMTKPGMMLEIVVVAYNEVHARLLSSIHAGTEGNDMWKDKKVTDCQEVGHPNSTNHKPQVLARYVQTPYKDGDQ